jgi:pimeloyl-ACP methyl ester carboxylesterase
LHPAAAARVCAEEERQVEEADVQRRTETVRGVPMAWHEQGEGLPVILIHGIPTGPQLWRHVTSRLVGVRLIAVEMIGYADSIPAGRERQIGVARQADYLRALLDELDIDRAVLVGHDLGGGVAQIAAVRDPQRCAGLVLANAISYDSWPIPSVKAMAVAGPLTEHLPDAAVKAVMGTLMARGHDDRDVAAESLDIHWTPYATHGAAQALSHQVRSLDVGDTLAVADRLPTLHLPAAVVWGVADQFQTIDYGNRLAFDLGADLHRIERGKHFVPEDHPDVVARAITDVVGRT